MPASYFLLATVKVLTPLLLLLPLLFCNFVFQNISLSCFDVAYHCSFQFLIKNVVDTFDLNNWIRCWDIIQSSHAFRQTFDGYCLVSRLNPHDDKFSRRLYHWKDYGGKLHVFLMFRLFIPWMCVRVRVCLCVCICIYNI